MKNLLTITEQRRFDFIELLVGHRTWMQLADIANTLNCSERVLRSDLNYFKNFYKILEINWSNKGLRIRLPHNVGMMTVSQLFLENSDYYSLLEHIFFSENNTVGEIASNLYKSSASVYRMIKSMNGVFNEHDIYIETNPVQIIGNERNIRYYFFNYFTAKYPPTDFPFTNLDNEIFTKITEPFSKQFQLQVGFAEFNSFKFATAINLSRFANGYEVEIQKNQKNLLDPPLLLKCNESYKNELENLLQTTINDHFMAQVFYHYVDKNYILDQSCIEEQFAINSQLSLKFVHLMNVFLKIQREFDIELPNANEFVMAVMNALYTADERPFDDFILYDENSYFIESIRKIAPQFLGSLEKLLAELYRQKDAVLNENNKNFLLCIIINNWKNIITQLLRKDKSIKVAVISKTSRKYATLIGEFLSFELSEKVHIEPFNRVEFDILSLLADTFDVVITDYPTGVDHPRLIYIENLPNNHDFKKVHMTIDIIKKGQFSAMPDDILDQDFDYSEFL